MTYKIAYEVHPNNETRVTFWRHREKRASLLEQASELLGDIATELLPAEGDAPGSSPHLTFVPNSEPPPISCVAHAYSRTDFGLNAARRIMRAAGAMDRYDSEISNYLFLTATLPGDTEEAKWAIANYSHILIDRLKSWFSKRLSNRKEFYVWEHQKRGALHFHYCIHCPDATIKQAIIKGFKRQWVRLLDGISKEFGVNLWGKWSSKSARYRGAILQARVEIVYKSVAAYMAGYLSGKGSKHYDDRKHPYYPKRWFGVSRPLSALVQVHTKKLVHEFESHPESQENFARIEEELLDDALTHTSYKHKVGEGKTHVFYHTQEKQEELWQGKQMLTHPSNQHPLIAELITSVLQATLKGQRLAHGSARFREALSPKSLEYFEDATYLVSLRRGAISQTHLRGIQAAFTTLDSSLDSTSHQSSFVTSLRKASLMHSLYHSQMLWNQHGWLRNDTDFVKPVDTSSKLPYARTSGESCDVPSPLDGSRAHVASEPTGGDPNQFSQCSLDL